jgi:membrane protease YdiL (CAAX protease family)
LRMLLSNMHIHPYLIGFIVCILQITLALSAYTILYSRYEKRSITELNKNHLFKYAWQGFSLGFIIQSLTILLIFLAGGYIITRINPVTSLVPGFIDAVVAGFVAEIVLRGIVFRLLQETVGTIFTLILFFLFFYGMHAFGAKASILSGIATALQAGFLLSVVYVYSGSLWLPIFLHFAWDFAEPAVYSGINEGISESATLVTSKITGNVWLTGGQSGPGTSLQSAIFCLIAGLLFLYGMKKKGLFIRPYWKRYSRG